MFVYVQVRAYINRVVFVYKQSWILTTTKFSQDCMIWKNIGVRIRTKFIRIRVFMFVYKHEVVRIRTLLMFVYVSNCSYTNTYLFVYKQLWILTPTKFMCSYTNKMWVVYVVFCLYTNKNMIVYKQKIVCIQTIVFVYEQIRVRIQTSWCLYTWKFASLRLRVYVNQSLYTYNFDCSYTNSYIVRIQTVCCLYTNNCCLYTIITDVLYTNTFLFVYKHSHVCIREISPLYKLFVYVEKLFVYKHVKVCLRGFWLIYKVVPLRGNSPYWCFTCSRKYSAC